MVVGIYVHAGSAHCIKLKTVSRPGLQRWSSSVQKHTCMKVFVQLLGPNGRVFDSVPRS